MPPPSTSTHEVTRLLLRWRAGDSRALDELIPLVEEELHRIARKYMQRERQMQRGRPEHTLQTTALVDEAYLRLVKQREVNWQNRAHFYAVAAELMRRILVDHARRRRRLKRPDDRQRVSLDRVVIASDRAPELLALDDALQVMKKIDLRKYKIVVMRYFGGMSVEEVAEVLELSEATVMREWRKAKAWLYQALERGARTEAEGGHGKYRLPRRRARVEYKKRQ